MARKTQEELNAIKEKYKVDTLWSYSRYDCYKQDKWEYYLRYILHEKEDNQTSIYSYSGSVVHDILEKLYLGKIKYEDMLGLYEDELFALNCSDLKYDRSDDEKNEKIANKYENCIRHFFTHHEVVNHPHCVEDFILIKITDDIIFQGYADFIYVEKVDTHKIVHIVDYKTSTKYSGQAIIDHGKQLLLYAQGIHQMANIPYENIVCEWNFLKYVSVTYEMKNGNKKTRYIERNVIGTSISNTVKMWLKNFKYSDEEINDFLDTLIVTNEINNLPQEIQDKIQIHDCYIEVPIDEKIISELNANIIETLEEITSSAKEYQKTHDEMIWWQEVTDADSFRLAALSGYSRAKHKPYDEYLKNKEMFNIVENNKDEDNDLLELLNSL